MRSSSDLIDQLVADLAPAPRSYVTRRMSLGIGGGAALSLAVTLVAWGPRPDLAAAITAGPFWIKALFTACLAVAGIMSSVRLARPGSRTGVAPLIVFVALTAMTGLAAVQLAASSADGSRRLVMGSTAASCPWLIIMLAVPIFAGALWAMRLMAPTRLTHAGAAIGLTAGSLAASVYAISCDESAAPFVLLWYGLGIAVPTLIGAALGSRVLRW